MAAHQKVASVLWRIGAAYCQVRWGRTIVRNGELGDRKFDAYEAAARSFANITNEKRWEGLVTRLGSWQWVSGVSERRRTR